MRLTTKGRYAVTAMLDLAVHAGGDPIALADISRRQGISLSYLEQLFAKLRRNGLVCSTRGPGGGYSLARPSAQISVAEVIRAVDETVDATACGGQRNCQGGEQPCLSHELWADLSRRIEEFLGQISLADVVNGRVGRERVLRRRPRPAADAVVSRT
ncbi:MAG: Fe-S cluster assembly transcriptional regulator IscR [Gammaproteobacteria bacterium]|nr:MAG: Fe-S cluster assembly transcriptional regulator IscR [Gammaproteobacteria bacterium]